MEELIIDIMQAKKEHLLLVGGKGANLGDLARGLTVPPGFILTSWAYREQMQSGGLQQKLLEILEDCKTTDLAEIEKASDKINLLFDKMTLLPEIESRITQYYEKLAEGKTGFKVAVRSSATAEDLSDASFAGQQETFLNISGIENVLKAVKDCWASLWTPRAIHYRSKRGFAHDEVWMAVIIQEMVPAQVAGVMFTANPINHSRNEIIIEAAQGLGEAIVSGEVTGDSYVIAKNDVGCEIISGTVNNPTGQPLLADFDIRLLALIGIKIERFYEDYQDVEWAFYNGKFYFLQTRAITTLGDEVLPEIKVNKMKPMQQEVMKWVEERFPNPVHPIDGVVVKVLLMALYEAMQNHGYKVDYVDWQRIDAGTFPEFFTPPKIATGLTRFISYLRVAKILKDNPAEGWASEQVYLLELLERLQKRDVPTLPLEIIVDYITEAFSHLHFFIVLRYHYFMWNRIPTDYLRSILKFSFGDKYRGLMQSLMSGIPCITLDINQRLEELAQMAKQQSEVAKVITELDLTATLGKLPEVQGGQEFVDAFNTFISEYGERETDMGLGGIASPTWQDVPEVALGIIKGMVLETLQFNQTGKTALCDRVKEAEERVYGKFSKGIYGLIGFDKFVRRLVEHSRSFAIFRENSHYHVTKGMHVFRILFLQLGDRFVRREILKERSDIFYLTYFEVKEIVNTIYNGIEEVDTKALYKKIEMRKIEQEKRYRRWKNRLKVEDVDENNLQGRPSSAGVIKGTARVINDPKDFGRLKPGDILVAPYTNPAWTPVFSVIGGLVVDSGGAASHASIIAREYGIPAVMGVKSATQLIQDGELITVDGSKGIVYREKAKANV